MQVDIKMRHFRYWKEGRMIAVRKPVSSLKFLERIDAMAKPEWFYYTVGRFFRPHDVRSRNYKPSFFLYQDQMILDLDYPKKEDIEAVLELGEKVLGPLIYACFSGTKGYHLCFKRPVIEHEENPWKREISAQLNNARIIKEICEKASVEIDMLPSPRHLFKVPHRFKYANASVKVWGPEGLDGLMTDIARRQYRGRTERPPRFSLRLAWSNAVLGTKGNQVLFIPISRGKAMKIVERIGGPAFYVDCEIPYLAVLQARQYDYVKKVMRRWSSSGHATLNKYKHIKGILEGDIEVLDLDHDPKKVSKGHAEVMSRIGREKIEGVVGSGGVKFALVLVR